MGKDSKPTDQIVLEVRSNGDEVAIHNTLHEGPGGRTIFQARVPLPSFVSALARTMANRAPLNLGIIPAGMTLRWMERTNGWYVFLVEEAPGPHTVQWLRDNSKAQYGSSASYQTVTLAFPWIYFFLVLAPNGQFARVNSVYFRNRPLISLEEPLFDPHFFNCSVDAYGGHCWICNQYTQIEGTSLLARVDSFIRWFWNSGFNASSEHHESEKGSFWTYNRNRISDRRVQSITAWVEASRDPNFAVTVPWVPADHTPLTVSKELTVINPITNGLPCTTRGFANLIQTLSKE